MPEEQQRGNLKDGLDEIGKLVRHKPGSFADTANKPIASGGALSQTNAFENRSTIHAGYVKHADLPRLIQLVGRLPKDAGVKVDLLKRDTGLLTRLTHMLRPGTEVEVGLAITVNSKSQLYELGRFLREWTQRQRPR